MSVDGYSRSNSVADLYFEFGLKLRKLAVSCERIASCELSLQHSLRPSIDIEAIESSIGDLFVALNETKTFLARNANKNFQRVPFLHTENTEHISEDVYRQLLWYEEFKKHLNVIEDILQEWQYCSSNDSNTVQTNITDGNSIAIFSHAKSLLSLLTYVTEKGDQKLRIDVDETSDLNEFEKWFNQIMSGQPTPYLISNSLYNRAPKAPLRKVSIVSLINSIGTSARDAQNSAHHMSVGTPNIFVSHGKSKIVQSNCYSKPTKVVFFSKWISVCNSLNLMLVNIDNYPDEITKEISELVKRYPARTRQELQDRINNMISYVIDHQDIIQKSRPLQYGISDEIIISFREIDELLSKAAPFTNKLFKKYHSLSEMTDILEKSMKNFPETLKRRTFSHIRPIIDVVYSLDYQGCSTRPTNDGNTDAFSRL